MFDCIVTTNQLALACSWSVLHQVSHLWTGNFNICKWIATRISVIQYWQSCLHFNNVNQAWHKNSVSQFYPIPAWCIHVLLFHNNFNQHANSKASCFSVSAYKCIQLRQDITREWPQLQSLSLPVKKNTNCKNRVHPSETPTNLGWWKMAVRN
jgi:hypothetical protein